MAFCKFVGGLRNTLTVASRNTGTRNHATMKECKDRLRDLHVPEKPKKPLTPYFRFLAEFRQDLVKSKPDIKVTDIVKQAAIDWAKKDASLKSKYMSLYKEEQEAYNTKMSAYTAQLTPQQQATIQEIAKLKIASKKKRELRKKTKDLDKPKRPVGPYMHYLLEKSKATGQTMAVAMQQLKGQYQLLPEADKRRYTYLYEEDKKRYNMEMLEWERKMLADGHEDVVRVSSLPVIRSSRLSSGTKPKKQ